MKSRGFASTLFFIVIVFFPGVTTALSSQHTFREVSSIAQAYNSSNIPKGAAYTYVRASYGVPTIANPVVILNPSFGLSGTGYVALSVGPIQSFAVQSEGAVTSASLPTETLQRIMPLGIGAQLPATGTRTGSTSAVTVTSDQGILLQTVLQPSRVFLYVRVASRTRTPQSLLDRLDGMESRELQWSAAEIKMWCNMPYLLSGRIDPLTGGGIRYTPPSGTPVMTIAYIVQCSDIPFSIDYEINLDNGDGTETTLENVQLISVYAMAGGLQLIPLLIWFYVRIRNTWRGRRQLRNWVPSARESLIFLSIASATVAAVAGITWVIMVEIENYIIAVRLLSLVIRDVVGLLLMPYIAGGYGTPMVTMTTRLRSLVIATVIVFAILNGISHICTSGTINIESATCEGVSFSQLVVKICTRFFSFFILVQHIQKLSNQMLLTDDPALNMQFFRYKSVRSIYLLLALWPIITAVLGTSIVSWYNEFIVSIGWELEVLLFNFMCVYHLGVYNPLIM